MKPTSRNMMSLFLRIILTHAATAFMAPRVLLAHYRSLPQFSTQRLSTNSQFNIITTPAAVQLEDLAILAASVLSQNVDAESIASFEESLAGAALVVVAIVGGKVSLTTNI